MTNSLTGEGELVITMKEGAELNQEALAEALKGRGYGIASIAKTN